MALALRSAPNPFAFHVIFQTLLSNALCGYQWKLEVSKVFKSKCPVFAQFWSKYDNSSADWWKTGQNLKEKYSYHIFVQNEAVIVKKPVAGVGETSNSTHRQITLWSEKKSKITFFSGASNIVKMGSEIYKYFSSFFPSYKIFDAVLRLVFNSSPKYNSHPACRLLELQLTFCKFSCCSRLCSTRTQILFKSETAQLAISKYFCLK